EGNVINDAQVNIRTSAAASAVTSCVHDISPFIFLENPCLKIASFAGFVNPFFFVCSSFCLINSPKKDHFTDHAKG
ncbi:MAG: hypothetical protein IKW79_07810, partial [Schwartzia sp.]|nr:hypothetical protein [Schwartzia sp. (in: firmicutes)]